MLPRATVYLTALSIRIGNSRSSALDASKNHRCPPAECPKPDVLVRRQFPSAVAGVLADVHTGAPDLMLRPSAASRRLGVVGDFEFAVAIGYRDRVGALDGAVNRSLSIFDVQRLHHRIAYGVAATIDHATANPQAVSSTGSRRTLSTVVAAGPFAGSTCWTYSGV